MRRQPNHAIHTFAVVIALGVATAGCGGSGSSSTATPDPVTAATTAEPSTTSEPATTVRATTTTEAPTTTAEPTTTTVSLHDLMIVWAGRTDFDAKLMAVSNGVTALYEASGTSDVDAVIAACTTIHDASAALAATLPSPSPALNAAVMGMAEDWDTGMHLCTQALASDDSDMFAKVPPLIEKAIAHLGEINSAISAAMDHAGTPTTPTDDAARKSLEELAASIGCTDLKVGDPLSGSLGSANCTFQGETILLVVNDRGSLVDFCTGNEGTTLSIVVGPTWSIMVGPGLERLLTALEDRKSEISVTMMFC